MLISDACGFISIFKLLLIDIFKNILKPAIIFLQDGVFRTHVEWPSLLKGHVETASCKSHDTLISVVHAHRNTCSFELVNLMFNYLTILTFKFHGQLTFSRNNKVCCPILVAESMSTNDNRTIPVCYQSWDILDNNWLTENSAIKDVADSSIRTFPHLLQVKFLHTCLVRCNCGTLNANSILFYCIGCINGYLIIGLIPVFNS